MKRNLFTIREMCDLFDVTPRTLRFYEVKEILFPVRGAGNQRYYTFRDKVRIKMIMKGKRFGFSLEEIRQLLAFYDTVEGPRSQREKILALSEVHLAEMIARRETLDATIAEMNALLRNPDCKVHALSQAS